MKKIDKIIRSHDVISGGGLEELYSMESFPVFIGFTNQPKERDVKSDMCWYI